MSYKFNASKMTTTAAAAPAADGWHTVERRGGAPAAFGGVGSGRPMPAAFGGGQRERDNARREEEAQRRWADRQREAETKKAAEAEAARKARVFDFESKDEYPTLGGAGAAKKKVAPAAAAPLNFRDMARDAAARAAVEEAAAVAEARRRELEASTRAYSAAAAAAPLTFSRSAPLYRHGSYDDGPVDHDYDESYEDNGGAGYDGAAADYEEEVEENAEAAAGTEFNAHLAVMKRRGDKSDW